MSLPQRGVADGRSGRGILIGWIQCPSVGGGDETGGGGEDSGGRSVGGARYSHAQR
jgi:hypothetical protein